MRTRIVYGLLLAFAVVLAGARGSAAASDVQPTAASETPARFYLVQDAAPGGPPPGMGAGIMDLIQRAQPLRFLADPDVRAEIGLAPEQEQKINELREKATGLFTRVREDMQARFQQRLRPDMTDEERQALRQEAMQAMGDAMQEARASFEGMMEEANTLLTPQQKEKLAAVTQERSTMDVATGGLSILLTAQAREACDLTRDQIDQIRVMLKGLTTEAKELRDRLFGADRQLTAEDMKSDKFKEMKAQHEEMVKRTRDKILSIFGAEQREKVEKFLANRRGFGGRMGGMGGMRGPMPGAGGPPANPPAPAPAK